MNRFLITVLMLITGFFALTLSLLLVIPLTIAALITGKKLQNQLHRRPFYQAQNNQTYGNTIDGEFEEVNTHSKY
ncbi:hypothetical protein O4H50_07910 [Vibrio diazotrophicus]|uniref:hypothetical protein n=1 Tax=Vibrio diazotrophicus TaxID=685 RepID=UPI0022B022DA|nr:hypothetical protein [Vibrio diazotrophicus]MCZ4371712.1 hypothetical protein [Vibrio diazotrophicus]